MTNNPGGAGPMTGDLRALAESFADIGAQVGARDAGPTLQAVVDTAVERVSGTRWASITSLHKNTFSTVVSTGETARLADAIQYAVGSGPCVDAIVDDAIYRPHDLRQDVRWPEYGRRVSAELGIRSMVSYRLSVEVDDSIDGLNLYSDEVDAFSDEAVMVGLMVATHGAVTAALVANRHKIDNLEQALRSSREIGMAMGVLMANTG
ncbi:ANTAR domain-containing protein [Monashia sp. NPDC004114]